MSNHTTPLDRGKSPIDAEAFLAEYPDRTVDVARKAGVSGMTVLRKAKAGKIHFIRVAGELRFKPDAALELIEEVGRGPELTDEQAARIARLLG